MNYAELAEVMDRVIKGEDPDARFVDVFMEDPDATLAKQRFVKVAQHLKAAVVRPDKNPAGQPVAVVRIKTRELSRWLQDQHRAMPTKAVHIREKAKLEERHRLRTFKQMRGYIERQKAGGWPVVALCHNKDEEPAAEAVKIAKDFGLRLVRSEFVDKGGCSLHTEDGLVAVRAQALEKHGRPYEWIEPIPAPPED